MSLSESLKDLISDPFDGPFEGEDYFLTDNSIYIPITNLKLAANIMRKVNSSEIFSDKLVKIGQSGDNVILGFDTLINTEPVYLTKIGPEKTVIAEVKPTDNMFCIYFDKKRSTRLFKNISTAKRYIKVMHKELMEKVVIEEPAYD